MVPIPFRSLYRLAPITTPISHANRTTTTSTSLHTITTTLMIITRHQVCHCRHTNLIIQLDFLLLLHQLFYNINQNLRVVSNVLKRQIEVP